MEAFELSRIARRNEELCRECGTCREIVACPGRGEVCIGCGACFLACPYQAIELKDRESVREVTVHVDGRVCEVPGRVSVREALDILGLAEVHPPGAKGIFAPCRVGACLSCTVEINGALRPACITEAEHGMRIRTTRPEDLTPLRLVDGFMGHTVGGVGTPWDLKGRGYIEVACFAGGCNFRCPQCQNWTTTYGGRGVPKSPGDAARRLTLARERYGVDRMAISGGECTLNRGWLIEYLRELKSLNPDERARLHVDTNGSLLTPDYIDELVSAGMTDIGIDLKSVEVETFTRITGVEDAALARRYLETAWDAVRYISDRYAKRVFLGVGIPYNPEFVSLEEMADSGAMLAAIDPGVQVCVLDYRGEFRRRIRRPSPMEMARVGRVLKDAGLNTVLCQTARGHIKI